MYKSAILTFTAPLVFFISALGTPAKAAEAGAVLAACDRTPGCSYSMDKDGGIQGCSPKVCFQCDGANSPNKGQCHGVGATASRGTPKPIKGDVLKMLTAPSKASSNLNVQKSDSPGGTKGIARPSAGLLNNSPGMATQGSHGGTVRSGVTPGTTSTMQSR